MVLAPDQIAEQGRLHFQAIRTKELLTPPSLLYPDMGYDDAYAIASAIVDEYKVAGYTPSGKKVGLTSNVMRRYAGIDEPDYGRLPWEYMLISHMACAGGPVATPPLAKSYGWTDLVLPGIVIAVLGQVFGAYCGLIGMTIANLF